MGKVQFIRGSDGEELVVLLKADYDALLASLSDEDDDDIALYDARKAQLVSGADTVLPAEVSMLIIKGSSRIKAIRLWRGMKQGDLAKAAALSQSYLSDVEGVRRKASLKKIAALAKSLDVPISWIE
jgi:DNA-binding XRE family transcriptional regulator